VSTVIGISAICCATGNNSKDMQSVEKLDCLD
jgi:hypothetical protein